ncbi:methyl-accepting chemotaxis protein [Rhizobium sp. S163]|uniref:methyl-accepting chemotaxis protein n=1 Tax=Rhizobium sp. S163 TaxID=3055039 RepID=UPI0025A9E936|nr:methyl-accepting chemotaxis protein [Rhizobium sp. S163]MDM9649227.1 methyl-accepting chemotaxis protein [Rhizobium sp. S163]
MPDVAVKRPLWVTITACGFAAVLFSSVAIGTTVLYRQTIAEHQALTREAAGDLALIQTDMDAQQKAASALAIALAGEPDVARLVSANARDELITRHLNAMPAIKENGGLQNITFTDAKGVALARIHTPDKFGDDMTGRRKTVVAALASGKLVAGIEPGKSAVSMFASAPIIADGKTIGVVDVGTGLTNAYFEPIAAKLDGDITVYIATDGKFAVQASTAVKPFTSEQELTSAFNGEAVDFEIEENGKSLVVNAVPFKNFSGQTIGVLEVASNVSEVAQEASASIRMTAIGIIIVSLLSLLGFFFFARALGGVISRITMTMAKLASGDLSPTVEGNTRPDEIGAMARAVQVFKDNAVRTGQLEKDAAQQRALTEDERRANSERDRVRAEEMAQATSGLADGLKHLASGDLSFQLTTRFADDFETLRADFNQAVEQLRSTLTSVAGATSSIESGSREISQSADDLSKRTEQQAASLEETAAALDEITANVSNSSKRAEEARTVAVQANQSARQSGEVVQSAVDAMSRIERSSNEISNIIGVIDEIAFQTNLLALNAGVEAARAGDAGKGFAVVAQEVRELAQRSAKAAKEIKDLIQNSNDEVQNGVRLVSQTGESLRTIEAQIVTMNHHMDSIATSAREQSIGLAEVNTAVNQMDQVTQQNAAMVEEANAAGATLAAESAKLNELVERFRLNNVSAGPAVRALAHNENSVPSPARALASKLTRVFSGGRQSSALQATSADHWEEF